jgi:two-component system response regulator AtoC
MDGASALRDRVDALERRSLVSALEEFSGNQTRAAEKLGISRRALIYKMEKFGLKPRPQ